MGHLGLHPGMLGAPPGHPMAAALGAMGALGTAGLNQSAAASLTGKGGPPPPMFHPGFGPSPGAPSSLKLPGGAPGGGGALAPLGMSSLGGPPAMSPQQLLGGMQPPGHSPQPSPRGKATPPSQERLTPKGSSAQQQQQQNQFMPLGDLGFSSSHKRMSPSVVDTPSSRKDSHSGGPSPKPSPGSGQPSSVPAGGGAPGHPPNPFGPPPPGMFLGGPPPGMPPFGAPFQPPFGLEALYNSHHPGAAAAYMERFAAAAGAPGGPGGLPGGPGGPQGKAALDLMQQRR